MSGVGYYSQTREDIVGLLPDSKGKVVLDVGCGEGIFASSLSARETWGIEPYAAAASEAAKRLDRILPGKADACMAELPNAYFQMIIFNDSLEHMEDPWLVLRSIGAKLAPGGVVCASIPNVRWYRNLYNLLLLKDWEYSDKGILDRTHLRFFTRKSMLRLFHDSGYKVQEITGVKYSGGKFWLLPKLLSILTLFFLEDCFYKNYLVVAQPSEMD